MIKSGEPERQVHLQRAELFVAFITSAGVVVWRLLELASRGTPSGVDVANYYRVVEGWLGNVDLDGMVYPPVVPAIAGLARWLVGPLWAAHLMQAVAGVAPGLGVWRMCRTFVTPWVAGVAGLAVAVAFPTSATVAWGGVPQLLALGLWPIVTLSATKFALQASRAQALKFGALLTLTLLTSTLVGVAAVLSAGLGVFLMTIHAGTAIWAKKVGWALLPAIITLPWYPRILTSMSLPSGRVSEASFGEVAHRVLGSPWGLWALIALLAVAGWVAVLSRREHACAVVTAMNITAVLGLFANETRVGYLLPTALAVSSCGLATGGRRVRQLGMLVATSSVLTLLLVATPDFSRQVDVYGAFTPPGVLEASSWLRENAGPSDVVVVAPVDGVPTGWWVEASGVDAVVASREDWLFFRSERIEARLANRMLSAEAWPDADSIAVLKRCDVRWILLPGGWEGANESALAAAIARGDLAVAFRSGDTLVFGVVPAGGSGSHPGELAACDAKQLEVG